MGNESPCAASYGAVGNAESLLASCVDDTKPHQSRIVLFGEFTEPYPCLKQ